MKPQLLTLVCITLMMLTFGCAMKKSVFDQVHDDKKAPQYGTYTISSYDTPGMYVALPNNGEGSFT